MRLRSKILGLWVVAGTFGFAATAHAQLQTMMTVNVTVPVSVSNLHPDLASVILTCAVNPVGTTPLTQNAGSVQKRELPLVNHAVDTTLVIPLTILAAPSAVNGQGRISCGMRARLAPGTPRASSSIGFTTWESGAVAQLEANAYDPRFSTSVNTYVNNVQFTIPAAQ